jgi:hypothetical protein
MIVGSHADVLDSGRVGGVEKGETVHMHVITSEAMKDVVALDLS